MIELRNIERSYRAGHMETWVLRRVNLTIHPWEFVTIMGPSGAGKSTLLNVFGMLDDQWRGEFELGGYPRQVTITLANHPGSAATATFVVVGKQVNDLPVDLVIEDGTVLRIESRATRVAFEGHLIDNDEALSGTIEVASMERALVLRRSTRRPS